MVDTGIIVDGGKFHEQFSENLLKFVFFHENVQIDCKSIIKMSSQ